MGARPKINTAGLPECVRSRVAQKAAESWCYVTPDNRSFYVSRNVAMSMQAANGGAVFAPSVPA